MYVCMYVLVHTYIHTNWYIHTYITCNVHVDMYIHTYKQSALLLLTKCLQAKAGYTLRTTVPTPHVLETFRADSLDTKRWCSAPHLQLPTAGFAYSGGSTRCGLPLDV